MTTTDTNPLVVQGVVDDFQNALADSNWPAESGILVALLRRAVQHPDTPGREVWVETAKAVLRANDDHRHKPRA